MKTSIVDRIVSVFTYFTFGLVGIIWLIYVNLAKKHMNSFITYNIYQSIFISIIFTVFSYLYEFLIKLLSNIPFIGPVIQKLNIFFFQTPIYFGYSIVNLILVCLLFYLVIVCILGKKPHIPIISDIIKANVGA